MTLSGHRGTRRAAGLALLAVCCAALVLRAPAPAGIPAGLLLAFVLPGATLTGALFPDGRRVGVREHVALSGIDRIVLTVALSLAVLVLGGLALYALRIRLDRGSWTGLTAGVTLLAVVIGHLRQRRATPAASAGDPVLAGDTGSDWDTGSDGNTGSDENPETPAGVRELPVRRGILSLAFIALAVALLGGAGWLSLRSAKEQFATPVTALTIQPVTAAAGATPDTRTVSIGLSSRDDQPTNYRLQVWCEDNFAGADHFHLDLVAVVSQGRAWSHRLQVPATGRVTVNLYRPDGSSPYRTVFLDSG